MASILDIAVAAAKDLQITHQEIAALSNEELVDKGLISERDLELSSLYEEEDQLWKELGWA